jgi:hypothetical protein
VPRDTLLRAVTSPPPIGSWARNVPARGHSHLLPAAHLARPLLAGSSTTSTLIAAGVGALFTLVAVYFTNKLAEKREERNRQTLENLHKADREATEQVHRSNREDDLHREQLRELRPIVDDATRALFGLWSALGAFIGSLALDVGDLSAGFCS